MWARSPRRSGTNSAVVSITTFYPSAPNLMNGRTTCPEGAKSTTSGVDPVDKLSGGSRTPVTTVRVSQPGFAGKNGLDRGENGRVLTGDTLLCAERPTPRLVRDHAQR